VSGREQHGLLSVHHGTHHGLNVGFDLRHPAGVTRAAELPRLEVDLGRVPGDRLGLVVRAMPRYGEWLAGQSTKLATDPPRPGVLVCDRSASAEETGSTR
jgi:hypothetical protein